ncbi:interferon-induced protein 44-like [Clarias gariepinus]
MGSSVSKPDFITVLANKQVKSGETIKLFCKSNSEVVTATWEKDGIKLRCVKDKHFIREHGTMFSLEIVNAQESDNGKYTIVLKNKKGEISCSSHVRVELTEWRTFDLNQKKLIDTLKAFKICNKVPELHFLLYGPVGAGKSSTINTIKTIFVGRPFVNCLAAALSEESHTKHFDRYEVPNENGSCPFAFYDTMGVQAKKGVLVEDIISALKGHIKVGYMWNPTIPILENSMYYRKNPSLCDQMHCLLSIIPADRFAFMENDFIKQFKTVSKAARDLGVPQVVLMTRVDSVCEMTRDNLYNVYKSKKIMEKMYDCSDKLGVPVNCIFPIRNYHKETQIREDINCLMLDVLTNVVYWANNYVKK